MNTPPGPTPQPAVLKASDTGNYQPGSLNDFDRLYRDSNQRVLRMLLGILRDRAAAEDCLQETFVRALQAWPRWSPDAPAEAWLHRIALNVALSHHRRERLRTVGAAVRHFYRAQDHAESDDGAWSSDLVAALRRLKPRDAALIVLRFSHGYTNREISVAFGVAESTISSRLATAKARLRIELGRSAPSPPNAESLERPPDALYGHGHERSL